MNLKYRVAASFRDGKVVRSNFHSKEGANVMAYDLIANQDLYDSIWIEVIR
jgi:hypothetical protein